MFVHDPLSSSGYPTNHQHSSHSQRFSITCTCPYKNFGCYAMTNNYKCTHLHTNTYSGTSLIRTSSSSGPHEVFWLVKEVSLFQRLFSTLLYVAATTGSVLIREVSLTIRGQAREELVSEASLIARFHCTHTHSVILISICTHSWHFLDLSCAVLDSWSIRGHTGTCYWHPPWPSTALCWPSKSFCIFLCHR